MTEQQPEPGSTEGYQEATAAYDPELDDQDDDTTGYENDADANDEDAVE